MPLTMVVTSRRLSVQCALVLGAGLRLGGSANRSVGAARVKLLLGAALAGLLTPASLPPAHAITVCYDYPASVIAHRDTEVGSAEGLRRLLKDKKYKYELAFRVTAGDNAGRRLKRGDVIIIGQQHAGYVAGTDRNGEGRIEHFVQKLGSTQAGEREHYTLAQLRSLGHPGQLAYDPFFHEPLLRDGYTLAQLLHKRLPAVSVFRDKVTKQVTIDYQRDEAGQILYRTPYLHDTVEVWRARAEPPTDSIAGWWLWVRTHEDAKKKKITDLVPVFLNPATDGGNYNGVYFPYLTLQALHKTPDLSPSHLTFQPSSSHSYHYTWSYPDGTKGTGVMTWQGSDMTGNWEQSDNHNTGTWHWQRPNAAQKAQLEAHFQRSDVR